MWPNKRSSLISSVLWQLLPTSSGKKTLKAKAMEKRKTRKKIKNKQKKKTKNNKRVRVHRTNMSSPKHQSLEVAWAHQRVLFKYSLGWVQLPGDLKMPRILTCFDCNCLCFPAKYFFLIFHFLFGVVLMENSTVFSFSCALLLTVYLR